MATYIIAPEYNCAAQKPFHRFPALASQVEHAQISRRFLCSTSVGSFARSFSLSLTLTTGGLPGLPLYSVSRCRLIELHLLTEKSGDQQVSREKSRPPDDQNNSRDNGWKSEAQGHLATAAVLSGAHFLFRRARAHWDKTPQMSRKNPASVAVRKKINFRVVTGGEMSDWLSSRRYIMGRLGSSHYIMDARFSPISC